MVMELAHEFLVSIIDCLCYIVEKPMFYVFLAS